MGNKCFACQLCCAASKIICYQFCCCCLHEKKVPKTDVFVLMVGLKGVGKSHLLASLCNETTENIQPTDGFSMKDVLLETSVLHVKELGGSEKIRPYWAHYMDNSEGVIYVIDGTKIDDETLEKNKEVLHRVLGEGKLQDVPLLLTISRVESNGAHNETLIQNISDKLELNAVVGDRKYVVSIMQDISQFRNVLEEFSSTIKSRGS